MTHTTRSILLSLLVLLGWSSGSSAQVIPLTSPPNHPLYPFVPYRFQPYLGVPFRGTFGRVTVGYPLPIYNPWSNVPLPLMNWYAKPAFNPAVTPWTGGSGLAVSPGYMSGGTYGSGVVQSARRELEKAQADATAARLRRGPDSAAGLIRDQWDYERAAKPAVVNPVITPDQNEELAAALAGADETSVLTGKTLNQILKAIKQAEAKGAKGPSGFLPPRVLADIQFAGPTAADALNFIRMAGRLPFPAVFRDPRLKDMQELLENDFAVAAMPVLTGKSVVTASMAKLDFTLEKVRELASTVTRDLPFDEATATLRFLNHLDRAAEAMKSPAAKTLVVAAWNKEGSSVTDLIKHMSRYELVFGPALPGGSDSYFALQRSLATYLFVLQQPKN